LDNCDINTGSDNLPRHTSCSSETITAGEKPPAHRDFVAVRNVKATAESPVRSLPKKLQFCDHTFNVGEI
jgi:hypothetical protein